MTLFHLSELSTRAAKEVGGSEGTIGLVATGATEQHGPHLPLSTDTGVARALQRRVPELLDCDVLASPLIDVAMSDPQLGYAGTISLAEEVFAEIVYAHLRGLRSTGLKRIVVIDFNAPNFAGSARAVERFRAEFDDVQIAHQDDLDWLIASLWRAADHPEKVSPDHAGRIETSLALAVYDPAQIGDFEQLVGYTEFADDWWDQLLEHGTEHLSPVGVLGIPSGANAEEGERILSAIVEDYAAWIDEQLHVGLRS